MSYTLAYTGAEIDALLGKIDAIFVAEYGSTIYSEVTAAIAAGNKVIVANAGKVYVYAGQDDNGGYVFTQSGPNAAKPNATYVTLSTGNVWSTATVDLATLQQFYASLMEDTASGSIASFPDGAEGVPVKELTADIEPIQDLHGYSNPWPAGGGKNKAQMLTNTQTASGITVAANADGTVNISGTATANASIVLVENFAEIGTLIAAGGTFSLSSNTNTPYNASTFNVTIAYSESGTTKFLTIGSTATIAAGATLVGCNLYVPSGATVTSVNNFALQLESGAKTDFAPYSNICPISGYTGAEIYHSATNILPPVADEEIDLTGTGTMRYGHTFTEAGTYTIINGSDGYAEIYYRTPTADLSNRGSSVAIARGTSKTVTIDASHILWVFISSSVTDFSAITVNKGENTTEDPVTTYSVSWSDHGTVYRGTLEYQGEGKWKVTPTVAEVILDGTQGSWNHALDSIHVFWRSVSMLPDLKMPTGNNYAADLNSNLMPCVPRNGADGSTADVVCVQVEQTEVFMIWFGATANITTSNELNTWLAANPMQVVYAINNPMPFIVDGPDPETLLGDNNMWANTGDISVRYRCNTALYIEKKLGE